MRFFARLGHQQQLEAKTRSEIDEFLDKVRTSQVGDKKLLKLMNPPKFMFGDTLSIADLLAWDYTIQSNEITAYTKKLNKMAPLEKAATTIRKVLSTVPVLHRYKFAVVEQVCEILGTTPEQVFTVMTDSKTKKTGDLILALPALKLPGNPADLAKQLVEKVF